MEFTVEPKIYDFIRAQNPELLHDEKYKISVQHIEDPHAGMVCLGCGNRGYRRPFEIWGRRKVNVSINAGGKVVFQFTHADSEKDIKKMMEEDNWSNAPLGPGTYGNMSHETPRCYACGSGAVVPGYIGVESCESNGCAGCNICNDYWSPDRIKDECLQCSIPKAVFEAYDAEDPDTVGALDRWCDEAQCGSLFARSLVYNITIHDLVNEMQKKDLL